MMIHPRLTVSTKNPLDDLMIEDEAQRRQSAYCIGFFFGTTLRTLSDRVSTLLPGKNAVEEENYRNKQGYNRFKHIDCKFKAVTALNIQANAFN